MSDRLSLLKKMLDNKDIMLNALKVGDVEIFENLVDENQSLIDEYKNIVFSSGTTDSDEINTLIQKNIDLDDDIKLTYDQLYKRLNEECIETKRKISIAKYNKKADTGYQTGHSNEYGSFIDSKK